MGQVGISGQMFKFFKALTTREQQLIGGCKKIGRSKPKKRMLVDRQHKPKAINQRPAPVALSHFPLLNTGGDFS
jgi:hypothetical protein